MLALFTMRLRDVVLMTQSHVYMCCTSFLRVSRNLILNRNDHDSVAAERCFRYEQEDTEQEDAKEDGAHSECPLVAVVFDDVSRYQRSASDTGQKEQIPYSDASGAFVDEIEVTNGTLDQDLQSPRVSIYTSRCKWENVVGDYLTSYGAIPIPETTRLAKNEL